MADRTFSDLVAEALHDDFDPVKYTTKAGEAINDALQEVARRVPVPALRSSTTITAVPGTAAYSLPSDFLFLRSVVDTSTGYSLTDIEQIEDYDEARYPTSSGVPTHFIVQGSQVLLSPTPSDARSFIVRYQSSPADIAGTTLISTLIPDDYAYLLVAFARARLFRFEDDPQMGDYWQAQFETSLAKLRGDLSRRTRRIRRVGDRRVVRPWPSFRRV